MSRLVEKTRQLVKESAESIPEIGNNSRLGYWWVYRFMRDGHESPNATKLEQLYEYLAKKPLEL